MCVGGGGCQRGGGIGCHALSSHTLPFGAFLGVNVGDYRGTMVCCDLLSNLYSRIRDAPVAMYWILSAPFCEVTTAPLIPLVRLGAGRAGNNNALKIYT